MSRLITTGKTPLTASTWIAILSLSLVVNLPGLAVTPMLGTLAKVFPHTTQIEKQLLTIMPNLLIIPFVLLSGKLSLTKHKIATVVGALIIFTASAVAYLFASTMTALIIFSATLGIGAGLLIPFSTGLLADTFTGRYRMQQMGLQSGVSNLTLVLGTYAVGWLAIGSWHLPFVVYLVGLIPLLLSIRLKGIPEADLDVTSKALATDVEEITVGIATLDSDESRRTGEARQMAQRALSGDNGVDDPADLHAEKAVKVKEKIVNGFYLNRLISIIGLYFFISFATMSISYYCPFLVEKEDWSTSLTGAVTALYFFFIFVTGVTLPWLLKFFRKSTFIAGGFIMLAGLAMFALIHNQWSLCIGASLCGFGYGICQPLIYDKASRVVADQSKSTLSLAFVLAANYVAIVLTPFIIDFCRVAFHAGHMTGFAFYLCAGCTAIYCLIALWKRRSFAFDVDKSYYS